MTFHYVPAGVESYVETSTQLLVRHQPNKEEKSSFGLRYKKWELRDKTVWLAGRGSKNTIAPNETADVILPIFSASYVQAAGLTKALANPIHGPFFKPTFEKAGIENIIDSGGFQMLSGATDFVDPDDVIERYNTHANIGMPLDLPVRSAMEPELFDVVSKLIRANDKYIGERLNKDIHLALISHGTSLEKRKRRLDVLDRPAEVVAIAGLNIKPKPGIDHNLNNAENLMYVIQRYHKTARYFHVLGVTTRFWMFIYSLIDASGYVREIGADSVSHRMVALTGGVETLDFRTTFITKNQAYPQPISCSCPVCTAVGDIRLLNNPLIIESHNLWVRAQQAKFMSGLSKAYVSGTITLKEIHSKLRLKQSYNTFVAIVNYIEEVISSDKFKPLRHSKTHKTLFDVVSENPSNIDSERARYKAIINKYEAFHKKKFL